MVTIEERAKAFADMYVSGENTTMVDIIHEVAKDSYLKGAREERGVYNDVIERTIKSIMSLKEDVGEFSLDLYYNDVAKENERFVARMYFNERDEVVHFRASSLEEATKNALEYVWLMTRE